jgi:hypothetical protein
MYETMQSCHQKDNLSIGKKIEHWRNNASGKKKTENFLGKRNKAAFICKTKEIKLLMN